MMQEMVGVAHGIVVAVGDLFAAAAAQVAGLAAGLVVGKAGRVALEVGWAVVAQLVQHDHPVAFHRTHALVQLLQQDLIHAAAVLAQAGDLGVIEPVHGQVSAHALAAGLVVPPQRGDAGAVEHMQLPVTSWSARINVSFMGSLLPVFFP